MRPMQTVDRRGCHIIALFIGVRFVGGSDKRRYVFKDHAYALLLYESFQIQKPRADSCYKLASYFGLVRCHCFLFYQVSATSRYEKGRIIREQHTEYQTRYIEIKQEYSMNQNPFLFVPCSFSKCFANLQRGFTWRIATSGDGTYTKNSQQFKGIQMLRILFVFKRHIFYYEVVFF